MALLNIFDIAGSALTAQSQRLNVAASNLANADSVTGPDGQPYRAKQVVFQVNAAPGAATGGVKVADVIESQAPDKLVYEPGNPLADAKGYVKMRTLMSSGRWLTPCRRHAAIRPTLKCSTR